MKPKAITKVLKVCDKTKEQMIEFFEYSKREKTPPYAVFQDWGNGLGCMEVASLAECEKDGGSEWYIYRMTMEQPAHYLLKGIINSANAMGMTPMSLWASKYSRPVIPDAATAGRTVVCEVSVPKV